MAQFKMDIQIRSDAHRLPGGSLDGLARFEFKRMKSKDVTLWFLTQRVFPPVIVLAPFYPTRRVFLFLC
jgi:hypothetical protein